MRQTPTLRDFLDGYLNEDWPFDYPSAEATLADWIVVNREDVAALRQDVLDVLASPMTEGELGDFVLSQGASYVAPPEEGGYRGWLQRVLRQLDE